MYNIARIKVKGKYKRYKDLDPLQEVTQNIIRNITPDLRVAIGAGCKIETTFEQGEHIDTKIIISTVNPVSILKNEKGQVVHVVEMSPNHPKYKEFKNR